MGVGAEARRAAREARRNDAVRIAARSGYVASALLRLLIGVLALLLAAHVAGAHPGASGSFETVAAAPGGVVILAVVAAADFALAAWLIVRGLLHRDPHRLEQWRQRIVYWGRSAVYLVIGLTAARFALGASRSEAVAVRQRTGRDLLAVPGGTVVLALVGATVVVVGVGMVWVGASRRFERTVRLPRGAAARRLVVVLGVAGYVAQGATIAVVGGFAVVAAFTLDPGRAGGLDPVLTSFAHAPWGRVFLVLVGAGWIVAGLYAAIRSRIARLG